MDKILFIVNPIAGGGRAKSLLPIIEEAMNRYEREYKTIFTTRSGEAIGLARDNARNYSAIVAVGGDGTINEVAKGIISAGVGTLGIIPGGTGNDMARSLGIALEPERSLEILNKASIRHIDMGEVNNNTFINIASVGFDAEVIANHKRFKDRIKGRAVYILSVIYTLFQFKDKDLEIEIDGKEFKEKIMLLAVGKGKYYGGGMKILPMAKLDDGYLYISIISGIGRVRALLLFPSIFKGNHIKYKKYVKTYRARQVRIKSEANIFVNIDGEISFKEKDIEFNIIYKKLRVIC